MTRYVAKRIRYRAESLLLTIAVLDIPLQANAHAPRCSDGLTTKTVYAAHARYFEARDVYSMARGLFALPSYRFAFR